MNNENKKGILGEEFLLKKDQKHLDLLTELNEQIKKWEMLDDKANKTDKDKEDLEKQIKDIAKFISNHYRTFVARLQQGVKQDLLRELFARDKETGSFKYKKAYKSLKEAADRGLIFAVAKSIGCDNTFLIDPNDEHKKTLKIIVKNFGDTWMKKINVYAHAWGLLDETFHDAINNNNMDFYTLTLIPFNNKFLHFISSRQTEGVENTCKIINYFTEKYLDENRKKKSFDENNEKMDVTLEGASQGVDFITKMVGSTHGREDTRIKNANITLKINYPHLFQDEQKILKRLINGISNEKNNNTIKYIFIKNDFIKNDKEEWLHPICKTDNLSKCLKYHQKELNNVEIKDLRRASSNQQNAFY